MRMSLSDGVIDYGPTLSRIRIFINAFGTGQITRHWVECTRKLVLNASVTFPEPVVNKTNDKVVHCRLVDCASYKNLNREFRFKFTNK